MTFLGWPPPPRLTRWLTRGSARPSTSLLPGRREDVDGGANHRAKPGGDGLPRHDDEDAAVAPLEAPIPQPILSASPRAMHRRLVQTAGYIRFTKAMASLPHTDVADAQEAYDLYEFNDS